MDDNRGKVDAQNISVHESLTSAVLRLRVPVMVILEVGMAERGRAVKGERANI